MKKHVARIRALLLLGVVALCSCDDGWCYVCNGSGRCSECNGAGVLRDSRYCYACDGSGKCRNCGGTGRVNARPPTPHNAPKPPAIQITTRAATASASAFSAPPPTAS